MIFWYIYVMLKIKKDIKCYNCGYPLKGDENYCPYCGQKNDIRPLSIQLFFQNMLDNFFNFDNKIWQTLTNLLKNPGKVPLEYIQGKRVRYSNPFRFLLQVSLIYFLFSGLINMLSVKDKPSFININTSINDSLAIPRQIEQRFVQKLDSLDKEIQFCQKLQSDTLNNKQKDSLINKILQVNSGKISNSFSFTNQSFSHNDYTFESLLYQYLKGKHIDYYYPALKNNLEFEKMSFLKKIAELSGLVTNEPYKYMEEKDIAHYLQINDNWQNRLAIAFPRRLKTLFTTKQNQRQYKQAVMSKISIGLFFVLPVFSLWVYLLYYKKAHSYTETLIFVFYLQSVYFLLLLTGLIMELLPKATGLIFSITANLWFVYYIVKSFEVFYKQNFLKTTGKVLFLVMPVYLIMTAMGFLVISVVALLNN